MYNDENDDKQLLELLAKVEGIGEEEARARLARLREAPSDARLDLTAGTERGFNWARALKCAAPIAVVAGVGYAIHRVTAKGYDMEVSASAGPLSGSLKLTSSTSHAYGVPRAAA